MLNLFRASCLASGILIFGPNPIRSADDAEPSEASAYQKAFRAEALIHAGGAMGTGWLADRERGFVVTNWHVAGKVGRATAAFPVFQKDGLITDRGYYAGGGKKYGGTVVFKKSEWDLAVIALDSVPEGVAAIPLAPEGAQPGDHLLGIGTAPGTGPAFSCCAGTVREVIQRNDKMSSHLIQARFLMTHTGFNPGDSGCGVVNTKGELVAVYHGTDGPGCDYLIDVSEVRKALAEARKNWALKLKPTTAFQFKERGIALRDTGKSAKAIDDFTEALKLDPRDAVAYRERGLAEVAAKEPDKAIADFTEALKLDPKDFQSFEGRADAHEKKNESDEAKADRDQAARCKPAISTGAAKASVPLSIYQNNIHSIACVELKGDWTCGCVVDVERRLLVTAAHNVWTSDNRKVLFPIFKDGRVVAERSAYGTAATIPAHIIYRDAKRDLAVLQLDRLPEGTVAPKIATESPLPGEQVHAVSQTSGTPGRWGYRRGMVQQLYHRTAPKGDPLGIDANVLEVQALLNEGDNGSPVFNDRGELVGITVVLTKNKVQTSCCIEAREVKEVVEKARGVAGTLRVP